MLPASHPLWGVLKVAAISAVVIGAMHFNYNGWDGRDALTLLEVIGMVTGLEWWHERKLRD